MQRKKYEVYNVPSFCSETVILSKCTLSIATWLKRPVPVSVWVPAGTDKLPMWLSFKRSEPFCAVRMVSTEAMLIVKASRRISAEAACTKGCVWRVCGLLLLHVRPEDESIPPLQLRLGAFCGA